MNTDKPQLFTAYLSSTQQQCDAWSSDTLLDSMELGGLTWPSSCRNGTCRTCMCLLTAGTVHYQMDWPGLTAEEKAQGYALPCVAYPDSDIQLQAPDN